MEVMAIPGFSEPFSSVTHLLASFIFLVLSVFLISKSRGNTLRVSSFIIFAFSTVFLFAMSGVYHLLEKGSAGNHVLRILDYDGIFLLIAGTFTPIHVVLTRGASRWLVLTIVWSIGILGIVFTSIYFSDMPGWLNLSFYLGMGWLGSFTLYRIYYVCRASARDMIFAGIAYTIGAIMDAVNWPIIWDQVIGPHEIFHVFVIIGAAFSWKIMFRISTIPISMKLTGFIKEYPGNKFSGRFTTEKKRFQGTSLENIKEKMIEWTNENYIKDHLPPKIKFKYFKEEIHNL